MALVYSVNKASSPKGHVSSQDFCVFHSHRWLHIRCVMNELNETPRPIAYYRKPIQSQVCWSCLELISAELDNFLETLYDELKYLNHLIWHHSDPEDFLHVYMHWVYAIIIGSLGITINGLLNESVAWRLVCTLTGQTGFCGSFIMDKV